MKTMTSWFLAALVASSFLLSMTRADLTYYIYAEEEQQDSTQAENTVVILRAIGTLPLHQSAYVTATADEGCPANVQTAGGINPNYLCSHHHPSGGHHVGGDESDHHNHSGDDHSRLALYPIRSTHYGDLLPVRFASFAKSRGTHTGVLVRKDVLVVPLSVAENDEPHQESLEAVSMGSDTSLHKFNTQWLRHESSDTTSDVVAEWALLDQPDGQPLEGGTIRLVKGKPPASTTEEDDPAAATNDEPPQQPSPSGGNDDKAISEEERVPVAAAAKKPSSCSSIAAAICSDENNDEYGTFCSLLMQVGLDTMLSFAADAGVFTVLAPTNDAFARAFGTPEANPALLSGHDLTRLLLSHVVVSGTPATAQAAVIGGAAPSSGGPLSYESLVCGTKQEMASAQTAKAGCDANAEVAYWVGPGNGGGVPKPKFLKVDQAHCNGILHTLDYVVLPAPEGGLHFHQHGSASVSSAAAPGSSGESASTSNEDESEPEPAISVAGPTNYLRSDEVLSFFKITKEDFEEEELAEEEKFLEAEAAAANAASNTNQAPVSVVEATASEPAPEASDAAVAPPPPANNRPVQGNIDASSSEFSSFFGRTQTTSGSNDSNENNNENNNGEEPAQKTSENDTSQPLTLNRRPGNLRRR